MWASTLTQHGAYPTLHCNDFRQRCTIFALNFRLMNSRNTNVRACARAQRRQRAMQAIKTICVVCFAKLASSLILLVVMKKRAYRLRARVQDGKLCPHRAMLLWLSKHFLWWTSAAAQPSLLQECPVARLVTCTRLTLDAAALPKKCLVQSEFRLHLSSVLTHGLTSL